MTGPSTPGDPPRDDAGEAIEALAALEGAPSARFWLTVRRKIERRMVTAHVADFSWELPKVVLIEFIQLVFGLFQRREDPKGGTR